jgi:hypothetical protein
MSDRRMTDEREALPQGAAHLGRRDVSVVTLLGMHRSGTSPVAAALPRVLRTAVFGGPMTGQLPWDTAGDVYKINPVAGGCPR